MKLRATISKFRDHFGGCRSMETAFTMIEIAIALAVIAFALIAIIGILPTGLQVNRDNREQTLINQDARLLIEAIKTGGRGIIPDAGSYSDIGSYVVAIENDPTDYSVNSGPHSLGKAPPGIPTTHLVQLLSDTNIPPHQIVLSSISGAIASSRGDFGFRYQVRQDVRPAAEFTNAPLANQVYEVRLRFAWPVLPNFNVSSEANTYVARTLISGIRDTNGFFYTQQYYSVPTPPNAVAPNSP